MLKNEKLARTKAQVTFYARNPRLAATAVTTAIVLAGAAGAQTATETIISNSDATASKTAWLAGGGAIMGTIMGVYGIRLAADFGLRRLGRAAK